MKSKKPNNQNRWQEIREEKGSTRKRDARNSSSEGELSLNPITAPQPWSSSEGGGRRGRGRGREPVRHETLLPAPTVLRKGLPRMSGGFSLSPISSTTKSTGMK
jgi:hypothetical protein